jgi:cellulose synthase/poly-beta-1,6-N-acetylglucosamine synthase-like glycosyltransferase
MSFNRQMEILPAVLSWGSLALLIALSFFVPAWIALFIIVFDVYWFLKTVYLTIFLQASYRRLRKNMATNWLEQLKENPNTAGRWEQVWHLIILPMYKESHEVVRETFQQLAKSNYPKEKFIVVLGLEERAGEYAQEIGRKMREEFGTAFHALLAATHPANLPGENPGKSSNEAWATQEALRQCIDPQQIPHEQVLVSTFDVDTQIYPEYFGILTHTFLTTAHPQRSSYQPVPFFLNNVFEAPALSRIVGFSGTFWHLMQQSIPEKLVTFSSHTMPLKPLVEIGFWQKDIVSEDSRIFFQCYTHYDGDWRVVPLLYPVSMDANLAHSFWATMKNLYKQQRRWAWGAENIAYLLGRFRGNKKIPFRKKWHWAFHLIEGAHSWATNSIIIFSLGWLPVLVGGQQFRASLLAFNLPTITSWIMTLTSVGIVFSVVFSLVLLPRTRRVGVGQYLWYALSWALVPISMTLFGSFPALDAQTRLALSGRFRLDFWVTPKHRKKEL